MPTFRPNKKERARTHAPARSPLLADDQHLAGTDRPVAFTDGEPLTGLERDWLEQPDRRPHRITRHHPPRALRQRDLAGDVRGTEVELRLVTLHEGRMP